MADAAKLAAPFKSATTSANVWEQVLAMIANLVSNGIGKAEIEAQVDALINASPLPFYLKPFLIALANAAIDMALANIPPKLAKQP